MKQMHFVNVFMQKHRPFIAHGRHGWWARQEHGFACRLAMALAVVIQWTQKQNIASGILQLFGISIRLTLVVSGNPFAVLEPEGCDCHTVMSMVETLI